MDNKTELVKGLQYSRLGSGPTVLYLHYSADPAKDTDTIQGKKWVKAAALVYPDGGTSSPGWRKEMEMDPIAGSGELALPFFDEVSPLILLDSYSPGPQDMLYGGLDVGRNNPTAHEVAAIRPDKSIVFFWEFYERHVLLNEMARAIRASEWYDRLEWIASDPSIWDRNQYKKDEMTSLASMLQEDVSPADRLDKIMKAHERSDMRFIQRISMLMLNKEKQSDGLEVPAPKVYISKSGCPNLIRELRGLKYRETIGDRNVSEKLVDKDNHAVDAAKYLILSHPEFRNSEPITKAGTVGHIKKMALMSDMLVDLGMTQEEAFLNANGY